MATSGGGIGQCGGSGQQRVDCIIKACEYNMTDECFNAMLDPNDFPAYEPLLVRTCELGQSTGLNIPLSEKCIRVCRMDPDACRERRRLYCATRGDNDPRGDELCSCYLPRAKYSRLVADAIRNLDVNNANDLRYIQDLIQTNLLTPTCWYGPCTTSKYAIDTEIEVPCQSIGLCVQSIRAPGGIEAPSITLGNVCTIVNDKDLQLVVQHPTTQASIAAIVPSTQVDNVVSSNMLISSNSTSYFWLYTLLAIVVLLLVGLLIYLVVRYFQQRKKQSQTLVSTK